MGNIKDHFYLKMSQSTRVIKLFFSMVDIKLNLKVKFY